jgi:hypothetical protein
MSAAGFVQGHMQSCLPSLVPLAFTIKSADWRRNGKLDRIAVAEVEMFDGQPALLEVRSLNLMESHLWISLPGGDVAFENGKWRRVA